MGAQGDGIPVLAEPPDFGQGDYRSALVLVTNACNLTCPHCFVFRDETPHDPRDKLRDATLLHQLRVLRDRHNIKSMLFMGGEPMIRRNLVLTAMDLFEQSSIVTNGTYGIPSVPGHLVTVSLDGPPEYNDQVRGRDVFDKVRDAIFARDPGDGTTVILQMTITRDNAPHLEEYVRHVADWPVDGIAFTFYVPSSDDRSVFVWKDLKERDAVIRRLLKLKRQFPQIKANVGALELMFSDVCLESTGTQGENCLLKSTLPLYVGENGRLERTFCCYGNNVDCTRCGAYAVFNGAYHRKFAA
ncbi:MAG: radical SAM protein [Pseudomonadales bacterium]|jgi:MoaA/NifB/PqqE/SkfB family radical SAM enzyme|nr:radical SAM protein [Pseudomonadales bacterium]MDP6471133.1 radical SAM protein [Pseudomonadales bacterium]MDP6825681.1 radical SAM protein [Pseudomonadales bacterium]MDP6971649.1 radical SAM protein [Pseudomonadales bacterium]|tara:strand:+ start:204 stop:1103 length:900 start_codon:yes stop_codon:yes gene_type:complete